jgi:TolA-binding protein
MLKSAGRTFVFWSGGALLLIAAGAAAGIFFTQRPSAEDVALHLRTERLAQATIRSELETQIRDAQIRNEHLRNELTIERSARAELEKNLAQLQVELGRSKDHLAFYEQLLPPGPQGSIALRAVELERNGANLNYRVLLMRSVSMLGFSLLLPVCWVIKRLSSRCCLGKRYPTPMQFQQEPSQV